MLQRLRRLGHDAEAGRRLARQPLLQPIQIAFVENDGVFVQVADEAADLDVLRLADDDGVPPFADELAQGQVRPRHKRAGGVIDLQAVPAQLQLHVVGRAVGGQQHGRRPHFAAQRNAHGAGLVHPRHHVGVVDEVAEDGQRTAARQVQRQVHGVAHPETHAVMLGHADLHGISPLPDEPSFSVPD